VSMVHLEIDEKIAGMQNNLKNIANAIFRPISRKYDEAEHDYPEELDMFRKVATLSQPKKKSGEKETRKELKQKSNHNGNNIGTNMRLIFSTEMMCWGDAALLLSLPNAGLGNAALLAIANDEQIARFGHKWIAMAITEPQSGSDSGSISTTAELDGNEWVLNGEKIFVTCADRCDAVVVWATIDKSAGKAGVKSFIVEKGTPGFKLEKLEHKLGIRASDTGTFLLKDCRIPKENILGDPRIAKNTEGFKGAMKTFDNTRPLVAAMANGIAAAALDFLKEQLNEKGVELNYKNNVHNVSSVEKEYYRMEAELEAMRMLTWRAAWMADTKQANNVEASMAKAKSGRMATLITQKCCDILGPLGFSRKYLAEKWMRDSKIMDIFEGTGQIQHLIVARNVLNLSSSELK
jgi:acyl-CoA dehydrogenase